MLNISWFKHVYDCKFINCLTVLICLLTLNTEPKCQVVALEGTAGMRGIQLTFTSNKDAALTRQRHHI